ncbi:hypothetical protein [Pseudomonas sp. GWSMS-1]|uniref:hypothetical protein n=1 Tax=Pseudomonas sp. GWSMS-1 TaxID=3308997 RepID=UPI003CF29D3D
MRYALRSGDVQRPNQLTMHAINRNGYAKESLELAQVMVPPEQNDRLILRQGTARGSGTYIGLVYAPADLQGVERACTSGMLGMNDHTLGVDAKQRPRLPSKDLPEALDFRLYAHSKGLINLIQGKNWRIAIYKTVIPRT